MAEVAQVAEIEMAPWFHASNPATGDFYGAIVTDLQGALDRPTSAKVSEGLSDGQRVVGDGAQLLYPGRRVQPVAEGVQ